jgi:hypothetical protein
MSNNNNNMMIYSILAYPVEDGGVEVARMDKKALKGLCAKGYPNDVMGYHCELTLYIRNYKDSLARNADGVIDYAFSFETLRVKCSSATALSQDQDEDDDGDECVDGRTRTRR